MKLYFSEQVVMYKGVSVSPSHQVHVYMQPHGSGSSSFGPHMGVPVFVLRAYCTVN